MDSKLYAGIRKVAPLAAVIVVIGSAVGYAWVQNGNSLDFSETDYKIVISGSEHVDVLEDESHLC